MGIIVKDTINNITNTIGGNDSVKSIFSNPIYTCAVIAVACLLIALFIFRNDDIDDIHKKCIKLAIYVFGITLTIVYLYNKSLLQEFKTTYGQGKEMDRIMTSINGGGIDFNSDDRVPIGPIIPITIVTDNDKENDNGNESSISSTSSNTSTITGNGKKDNNKKNVKKNENKDSVIPTSINTKLGDINTKPISTTTSNVLPNSTNSLVNTSANTSILSATNTSANTPINTPSPSDQVTAVTGSHFSKYINNL